MPFGPTPLYLQIIQWANMIISLLYPLAVAVILFLAWRDFRRLVNHLAPETVKAKVGEEAEQAKPAAAEEL